MGRCCDASMDFFRSSFLLFLPFSSRILPSRFVSASRADFRRSQMMCCCWLLLRTQVRPPVRLGMPLFLGSSGRNLEPSTHLHRIVVKNRSRTPQNRFCRNVLEQLLSDVLVGYTTEHLIVLSAYLVIVEPVEMTSMILCTIFGESRASAKEGRDHVHDQNS